MSNVSKRRKEGSRAKIKSVGDHKEFLNRITKTLYYGQLPSLPCLSLPVTEISCAAWSAAGRGRSVRRLHADAAAGVARQACVSPCALVLALLYLERLNRCNKDYLASMHPQDLFLVSLMVGNKFLQDDGEDDEVICSEWAASGGIELDQLKKLEIDFLSAIEWDVFVSAASFEAGLRRLERAVALREGGARGFYTYGDLAAAGGGGAEAVLAAAAAAAALTVAYLAGVLALLASALLVARGCTHPAPAPAPAAAPLYSSNATLQPAVDALAADPLPAELELAAAERARWCAGWARLAAPAPHSGSERARPEPWRAWLWSWLHRGTVLDPVQRWLERIDEYADLAQRGAGGRAWLELAGLAALSDR